MISVDGKWALVTGASRGIGNLVSRFMAAQGCNLVLHGRRLAHIDPVLEAVTALGVEACAVEADFSNPDDISVMLARLDAIGEDVDILFNNAGVQVGWREDYFTTPVSDFDLSFRINTIAPAMLCYHFLPRMIDRGFGRVVNTTSGIEYEPEQAGYSASKAALDKFTVDLGSKLDGTNVMMNLVDPGWCRTDLGGPEAPNTPESTLPGMVVGAFLDDRISGRLFRAQDYAGMSLQAALDKAKAAGLVTPATDR